MRTGIKTESLDLDIDYRDDGPWRSYELTTHGETVEQASDNASITEVDQDGGEIKTTGLDDCTDQVVMRAELAIVKAFDRLNRENAEAARDYAVDRAIDEKRGA